MVVIPAAVISLSPSPPPPPRLVLSLILLQELESVDETTQNDFATRSGERGKRKKLFVGFKEKLFNP